MTKVWCEQAVHAQTICVDDIEEPHVQVLEHVRALSVTSSTVAIEPLVDFKIHSIRVPVKAVVVDKSHAQRMLNCLDCVFITAVVYILIPKICKSQKKHLVCSVR